MLTEDTVHLHLEQRVAQRLLARFRSQGFIHHDLSRACLAQAADSIPRVILLGRLSLYGQGAERLHEELVPLTARWVEPSQRKGPLAAYAREAEAKTLDLLERSLGDRGRRMPGEAIQRKLLAAAPRDIEELLPQLEPRAEELAALAIEKLRKRGEREEKDLRETLERQRERVREELAKHEGEFEQLTLDFDEEEKRQLESDMRSWRSAPRAVRPRSRAGAAADPRVLRGAREARRAGRARLPLAGDELSAMAKLDPEILAHLEWIGFVRPTGLVVSAPALVRAGAILDRRDAEGQRLLRACVEERTFDPKEGPVPHLPDFRAFAESVLGWSFSPKGYAGTAECPIPPELEVPLPDYGETLRPDFAVRELEPQDGASAWQLLVRVIERRLKAAEAAPRSCLPNTGEAAALADERMHASDDVARDSAGESPEWRSPGTNREGDAAVLGHAGVVNRGLLQSRTFAAQNHRHPQRSREVVCLSARLR